jgi:type II secretory pathway pseudopilin PulG
VELLIVIVVIGILATLVIVTFTGIQQRARDTARKTDINAVASHLEAFYASNGYYPLLEDVNDATWRATNMKGLDPEALKDPKGAATALAAATDTDEYGYAVTTDADGDCSADETTCTKYELEATLETGGTYAKQSN